MSRGFLGVTPNTFGCPVSQGMADAVRGIGSMVKDQDKINASRVTYTSAPEVAPVVYVQEFKDVKSSSGAHLGFEIVQTPAAEYYSRITPIYTSSDYKPYTAPTFSSTTSSSLNISPVSSRIELFSERYKY